MRILQKTCTSAATVAMLSAALCVSPAAAQVYNNTSAASTISAGVSIPVRTSEVINSSTQDGRIFTGVVDEDVFDNDSRLAIPRGSTAELMVKRSGGDLSVDLESLTIDGQRYAVDVDPTKTTVSEYVLAATTCKAVIAYREDIAQVAQVFFAPPVRQPYLRAVAEWVRSPISGYTLDRTWQFSGLAPSGPHTLGRYQGVSLTVDLYVRSSP